MPWKFRLVSKGTTNSAVSNFLFYLFMFWALTPICFPGSKTAELLSRLDTDRTNRSACHIAPPAAQSSRWKLPVLLRDPSRTGSQAHKDSPQKEDNQKLQKTRDGHQKNKLLETKGQHQEEERAQIHQAEHWRVNNAFLDRLQGKSQPGGLEQSGGCWNMNSTDGWGIWEALTSIWPSSANLWKPSQDVFS